ncbi:MAG TPA: hypothetical protein VG758_22465, partial [Hyphomicrobiaceae bacterium]|nr:hypothetical protein [Hyphomicrobiaceae bacterium]
IGKIEAKGRVRFNHETKRLRHRPAALTGCELARLGSAEQMASAGYTRHFDKRSWLKKVAQPFWRQPSRRTF